MANRSTKLGKVYRKDPERARRMIADAIATTQGNITKAAELLDLSSDRLHYYVDALELRRLVDLARRGAIDPPESGHEPAVEEPG